MDKTREEFIVFIRQAMNDRTSGAYEELYQFLVSCFTRADTDLNGKVPLSAFDQLIEEAAALPRKYGYAPTTESLYPTEDARKAGRSEWFSKMDTDKSGYITLDKWVTFANNHIMGKVSQLPKDYLGGDSKDVTKDEFLTFMKAAVDKSTPQYKELYFFLLKTFQKGDADRKGEVTPEAFDKMIEDAAAAPRRFGLAPRTEELFPNEAVSSDS